MFSIIKHRVNTWGRYCKQKTLQGEGPYIQGCEEKIQYSIRSQILKEEFLLKLKHNLNLCCCGQYFVS